MSQNRLILILVGLIVIIFLLIFSALIISGFIKNPFVKSNLGENPEEAKNYPTDIPEVFCPIFSCRDMISISDSSGEYAGIGFDEIPEDVIIGAMQDGTYTYDVDGEVTTIDLISSDNRYRYTYKFIDKDTVNKPGGPVIKGGSLGVYGGENFISDLDNTAHALTVTVKDIIEERVVRLDYDPEKRVTSIVE